MPEPCKLLLIGIDAGDIGVIRANPARLPRLNGWIQARGVRPLSSPAEILTSAIWPTFATGQPPGEHGIYYPMQWDASAMQLRRVGSAWVDHEPFWYPLARGGKRVVVLDSPFSLPTRLDAGIEVQNWGSQECLTPFQCNQPELGREILRRFGHHPMGEDVPVPAPTQRLLRTRDNLVRGAGRKAELARFLMGQGEWDLFVTVFAECHRGGHVLWRGDDPGSRHVPEGALVDVYAAVDAAVGSLVDAVDPKETTVVVFSLHGMRANFTQEHFLMKVMERINARFRGDQSEFTESPPRRGSPMRVLREMVPPQLQFAIAKMLPVGVRDWVVRRSICGGLDWSTTPGFAIVGSCEGYLRLSFAGRESDGLLTRDSAKTRDYVKFVREQFMSLRDPVSGRRVVKDVVSCAERYPGPRSDLLPDLVVLWEQVLPCDALESPSLGQMTGSLNTGRTGDHRAEGFSVVIDDSAALRGAPELRDARDFATVARHVFANPI